MNSITAGQRWWHHTQTIIHAMWQQGTASDLCSKHTCSKHTCSKHTCSKHTCPTNNIASNGTPQLNTLSIDYMYVCVMACMFDTKYMLHVYIDMIYIGWGCVQYCMHTYFAVVRSPSVHPTPAGDSLWRQSLQVGREARTRCPQVRGQSPAQEHVYSDS